MPGVVKADVNYTASTLKVQYRSEAVERRQIAASVREAGYRVRQSPETISAPATSKDRAAAFWADHDRAILTAASGLLFGIGFLLSFVGVPAPLPQLVLSLGIVVGGYHTARAALFALRTRSADMNVLMTAAVLGAIAIGEWTEAASVVFLFSLANTIQSYTMDRTRRSIRSLLELAPKEATLIRDGHQVKVPAGEIAVGDTLLVRPGESVATDGVVSKGSSTVNQAPITGESMPVEKARGRRGLRGDAEPVGRPRGRASPVRTETTPSRGSSSWSRRRRPRGRPRSVRRPLRPLLHAGGHRAGGRRSPRSPRSSRPARSTPGSTARSCCWSSPAPARWSSRPPCRSPRPSPAPLAVGCSFKGGAYLEALGVSGSSPSTRRARSPRGSSRSRT